MVVIDVTFMSHSDSGVIEVAGGGVVYGLPAGGVAHCSRGGGAVFWRGAGVQARARAS